jgi:hypothetical protein
LQPGNIHGGGDADVAGGQQPALLQQDVAGFEVEACGTNVGAARRTFAHHDMIAFDRGVLLDDDRVRAGGQGAAGKDAHGLAGADLSVVGAAGRRLSDDAQTGRDLRDVVGAHRIAVHGGDGGRRLGDAGGDVVGEDAAERAQEPNLLAAERMKGGDDARAGFGDRQHQRAL